MIKINIIPNIIKKEIKINFIYNVIKKILYILIIISSIFAIILMLSEHVLLSALATEINGNSLDFKNSTNSSQNKVNEINNELLLLEKVQNNFTRWSLLFSYISQNKPAGITLNNITIERKTSTITFNGLADTRDNLLSFKDFLESSKTFTNIDFPTKNLLLKENINFVIKSKIKLDEIK